MFGRNITGCKTWVSNKKFCTFAQFIYFQNSMMKMVKSYAESLI